MIFKKDFKVISKDEESFIKAQKLLQELISKNHIIKDELNSESVKLLTKDEVNNIASIQILNTTLFKSFYTEMKRLLNCRINLKIVKSIVKIQS